MLNWKTRNRYFPLLINSGLFIGGLFFFMACQHRSQEPEKSVFSYNEANGIGTLDPAYTKDLATINACEQLYNGLVQLDENMNIVPAIAHNWSISEDFLTYTFDLRGDVYFHKNVCFGSMETRAVKAQDFVYSFRRILAPKIASPGLWIFDKVDTTWNDSGFFAPNDSVFQIKLKTPYSPFLSILTMKYCSVIPVAAVEYYGTDFRKNPVGTGPFMFKFWEEGLKLVYLKNPDYFEKPYPFLDAVNIFFLIDRQSEFLLFLQNKIDFVSGISPALKDELLTEDGQLAEKYRGRFHLQKTPYLNTEYIGILADTNSPLVKNSPLKNLAFRQALNYSIDRRKMTRYLLKNIGQPAEFGMVPTGLWPDKYSRPEGYAYNPKKAEELFAQAKKELNVSKFSVISIAATNKSIDIVKFVQHEWSRFGIETEIALNQWAALREMVANNKVNLFRASWVADYPDAENYFILFGSDFFSPNGPNYTHFNSDAYDSLLKNINFAYSSESKFAAYRMMDSIIIANASVIPLYYDDVVRFSQIDIQGFTPNPMNIFSLKKVKK